MRDVVRTLTDCERCTRRGVLVERNFGGSFARRLDLRSVRSLESLMSELTRRSPGPIRGFSDGGRTLGMTRAATLLTGLGTFERQRRLCLELAIMHSHLSPELGVIACCQVLALVAVLDEALDFFGPLDEEISYRVSQGVPRPQRFHRFPSPL